jgi:hypothetical protein
MFDSIFFGMVRDYVMARAAERSTYLGIAAAIAASLHTAFSNEANQAFANAGLALFGLVSILMKEGVKK